MPYTTGTQGAQANPAGVLMTTLDPLLIAAGYTFVEQVVASAQTCRIYKSPAASNVFGSDWFLIVRRDDDVAPYLYLSVTEQYNSTTHLCFNYAPGANSLTPTASFAVNDATGKAPGNAALAVRAVQLQNTGFTYFLSLTVNRVVIATRSGSYDSSAYAGLYEDMQALAISPFPLVLMQLQNSSLNGFSGREPNTTTSVTNNFKMGPASVTMVSWTQPMPAAELYTNRVWISRVLLVSGRNQYGVRGLARDLWTTGSGGPIGVNGDTLNAYIGGVSKTLVQVRESTGSFFVDTSV